VRDEDDRVDRDHELAVDRPSRIDRLADERVDEVGEEVDLGDVVPARFGMELPPVEARDRERSVKKVPLDKVPRLTMDMASLTRQNFDPQEGFVLSRVNGLWDVGSILKLCPMNESDVLLIFARLLERKVIELS